MWRRRMTTATGRGCAVRIRTVRGGKAPYQQRWIL